MRLRRLPFDRAVFVLALTAAALFISLLLCPVLDPNFFSVFLGAVLLSAWYYGKAAGLLATFLSAVTVLYFFLPPVSSLRISDLNTVVRLVSFVVLGCLIAWVASGWRGSKGLLAATLSSIGDGVIATDRDGKITFLNSVAEALTGWRQAEAKGKNLTAVFHILREQTREAPENPAEKAIRQGAVVALPDHTLLVSKDGTEIPIEDSAGPIRDESGELKGVILVFRDVTGRRQLEERLRHSQKMDALGRLAGGVAGDFNNLLTVITGYSELLRAELAGSSSLRRFAEEIMYAAERAAALTRQLLAVSSGQASRPKLLDLNATVSSMEAMLRRSLGDNVELLVLSGPNLGRVRADPRQMEQVIMNLASNARDAMPNGGKLVLETANAELDEGGGKKIGLDAGSYVMLAVSDTGIGMDSEARSRVFEPFFTTKEQGKSSGLGLSTVYGIIRQSGGQITVYSQVGCGTIFEIYLPRAKEEAEPVHRKPAVAHKGSETILLVDDEETVRRLVSAVLQSNGYSVIEARNGLEALSVYEKNSHKVDLVITDVVMPQMNGFELGERLAEKSPGLLVLYISGYRDSPIGTPSEPERAFLHKPFTPDVLLNKVRELLDTRSQGATG